MKTEYEEAIARVLGGYPDLTTFGFGVYDGRWKTEEQRAAELQAGREDFMTDRVREQFERAVEFLSQIEPRATINFQIGSSYGLKHRCEAWHRRRRPDSDPYVPNGVFIAAAAHLGFRVYRSRDPYHPNAAFNFSSRSLSRLRSEA